MRACLLFLAFALVSYFPAPPLRAVDPPTLPPPGTLVFAEPAAMTFAELAALAGNSHPDVKIARAAVIAAQGRFIQSGLYPNPIIGYYGTDLNEQAIRAGKEGINIIQLIVTNNKLGLARAAASKGVAAADWTAVSRYFDVVSRLRVAYFDAIAAQREVKVNEDLLVIAEQGLKAAEKLVAAGTGARPDVLRARVDMELFRNRLAIARNRADATW